MAMSKPSINVAIAVIGGPGHGKSSFLNGLAKQKNLCKIGAGGKSCTQEVSANSVALTDHMNLTIIDTMGFPDPNPGNAIPYYDRVVEACNQPLNAIVWLMKLERKVPALLKSYGVLLREFRAAQCPIIVVVNAHEQFDSDDDEDEVKGKKTQIWQAGIDFGNDVVAKVGLPCVHVIAGTEKKDLKGRVRAELGAFLAQNATEKRSSRIRTVGTIKAELDACTDAESCARREEAQLATKLARLKEREEQQRTAYETLQKQKDGVKETRTGTRTIPGNWYCLWMDSKTEEYSYETFIKTPDQVRKEIEDKQKEMAELKKELDDAGKSDAEKKAQLDRRAAKTLFEKEQFNVLYKALMG